MDSSSAEIAPHRSNRVGNDASSATGEHRDGGHDVDERADGREPEPLSRCTRRALLRASAVGLVGAVGAVVAGDASAATSDSTIPGETGTVRVSQPDAATGHTVSFERTYENPIVIMKPVGFEGSQPAHVRLRDVSSSGFAFRIEEWAYLDGAHTAERLFYLVVESGSHTLTDGTTIQAGTTAGGDGFERVSFAEPFATRPIVFTQAQTYRGPHEIVTRNRDVSASGFSVRLQEEEGRDGRHTAERIGYVGIEPTVATGFEVGRTPDAVTDGGYRIEFDGAYDSLHLFADMQTYDGSNTAALRYRNLGRSSVDVFVEEERSRDGETNHATETVGYLVTAPGELFGDGTGTDPAGYGAGGYGVGAYGT